MNEEELFCKLFPEYTVNGKPLSPYFDLFESGFEAGNRIAELKKTYRKQRNKRIDELQKRNAQLKEANETLATMNNNIWVELEKKRAESQGITNKLHQLIEAKKYIGFLLGVAHIKNTYNKEIEEEIARAEAFLKE